MVVLVELVEEAEAKFPLPSEGMCIGWHALQGSDPQIWESYVFVSAHPHYMKNETELFKIAAVIWFCLSATIYT